MTLMPCPDCNRLVSDIAPACPDCGRPIAKKPTQIEATAKRWKAVMLGGTLVFLIGNAWMITAAVRDTSSVPGLLTLGLGLAAIVVAKTVAWWFHG